VDKDDLGLLEKTGLELPEEFQGTEKEEGITVSVVQIARGWLKILSDENNLSLCLKNGANSGLNLKSLLKKGEEGAVGCLMTTLDWNPDILNSSDYTEELLKPVCPKCQTIVWVDQEKQFLGVIQMDTPELKLLELL